jgi:hypothetical protein
VERSKCSRACRRLSRVRNCILPRKGIRLITAAARKALQDSLQEDEGDEDEDEQRYLNMNEEEGDVWDDNSAYIEMLAKEVRVSAPPPSPLYL